MNNELWLDQSVIFSNQDSLGRYKLQIFSLLDRASIISEISIKTWIGACFGPTATCCSATSEVRALFDNLKQIFYSHTVGRDSWMLGHFDVNMLQSTSSKCSKNVILKRPSKIFEYLFLKNGISKSYGNKVHYKNMYFLKIFARIYAKTLANFDYIDWFIQNFKSRQRRA